jgi:hypothetical protein
VPITNLPHYSTENPISLKSFAVKPQGLDRYTAKEKRGMGTCQVQGSSESWLGINAPVTTPHQSAVEDRPRGGKSSLRWAPANHRLLASLSRLPTSSMELNLLKAYVLKTGCRRLCENSVANRDMDNGAITIEQLRSLLLVLGPCETVFT